MKILKTAFLIVIIGVAIYVAYAILSPPMTKEVTLEIEQPAEDLFAVLADQQKMTQWVPDLKSVEQISGKPMTTGSVSKFVIEKAGRQIPFLAEINHYRKNEFLAVTLTHEKIIADIAIKVVPSGNSSKLDITYTIDGNTTLTKVAMPLIKPLIDEYSEMDLEELKKLLEKS